MKQCSIERRRALADSRVLAKLRQAGDTGIPTFDENRLSVFSPIERRQLRSLENAGEIVYRDGRWYRKAVV